MLSDKNSITQRRITNEIRHEAMNRTNLVHFSLKMKKLKKRTT